MKNLLVTFSIRHPKLIMALVIILTIAGLVQMPRILIDTDPENMLPAEEEVRLNHEHIKEAFNLNDFLVVGIVHPDGVFKPEILARVEKLTDAILEMEGIIVDDVLAPGEVDDIRPEEGGGIRVEALMDGAPETVEEAEMILVQIQENPILRGKLASEDGQAMAIFVPLESKDVAMEVGNQIQAVIDADHGDEEYHLAGLPVAEDTFGSAMFQQMAVSAPAAFLLIFLLLLFFFRKPKVVLAPMILAMVTVIWTMGLLIALGYTVHIMSSMIPIFLIPIAVLNSIHILSSMHAHCHVHEGHKERAIRATIDELFLPMAFTSLTTIVGFGALIATPIPPVQVFGIFVAFGVFVAWLLSIVFIPAYVMLLSKDSLRSFEKAHEGPGAPESHLLGIYHFASRFRVAILVGLVAILVVSGYGITKIIVNDNPVNWFKHDHPLRVADHVMNEHLAGTYLAYLELASADEEEGAFLEPEWMEYADRLQNRVMEESNVGAASSVVDVLKKVQYELLSREEGSNTLADTRQALAQYLFLYEMSGGSPDDLFKFITPSQDKINIWIQMRQGDNQAVSEAVDGIEEWVAQNPLPEGMEMKWAGLSYINIVWQDHMVNGMGKALLGSFFTVLVMMVLLFRSIRLGLLAMIPLSATIAVTYGVVGLTGRNYDMPTAVLSSLALGLSVDFAIHFIQRTRDIHRHLGGDFGQTMVEFFHVPGQSLARNIVVIALGFVPMFFATLVPYITVGAFFFGIMLLSGGATFLIMPALLSYFPAKAISKCDGVGADV